MTSRKHRIESESKHDDIHINVYRTPKRIIIYSVYNGGTSLPRQTQTGERQANKTTSLFAQPIASQTIKVSSKETLRVAVFDV